MREEIFKGFKVGELNIVMGLLCQRSGKSGFGISYLYERRKKAMSNKSNNNGENCTLKNINGGKCQTGCGLNRGGRCGGDKK